MAKKVYKVKLMTGECLGHSPNGNILALQVAKREGQNVGIFRRIFSLHEKIWNKYQNINS